MQITVGQKGVSFAEVVLAIDSLRKNLLSLSAEKVYMNYNTSHCMSANSLCFSSLSLASQLCWSEWSETEAEPSYSALHVRLERLIAHPPLLFLVREKSFKLGNSLLTLNNDGLGDGRLQVK